MDNQIICIFIMCFEKLKNIRCVPAYQAINSHLHNFEAACFHRKKRVVFYTDGLPGAWTCDHCGKIL